MNPQDELSIIRTVNAVGTTADGKDWAACRPLFAGLVYLDYTSLVGGQSTSVEADQLIESWKAALNSVLATQHMITNHQVVITGDEATCLSYVQAFHWHPGLSGGDSWTVFGSYEHHLVKTDGVWKIVAMKLSLKRQEGNLDLLKQVASKS